MNLVFVKLVFLVLVLWARLPGLAGTRDTAKPMELRNIWLTKLSTKTRNNYSARLRPVDCPQIVTDCATELIPAIIPLCSHLPLSDSCCGDTLSNTWMTSTILQPHLPWPAMPLAAPVIHYVKGRSVCVCCTSAYCSQAELVLDLGFSFITYFLTSIPSNNPKHIVCFLLQNMS